MKRKVSNFSLLVGIGLLSFGVVGLAGCGSSQSSAFVAATVSLNKSSLNLAVGEVEQIKATVSKGYGSDVRWFTSNESVAHVSDGYVFAVGEGQATVTASIGGGYADCLVTVAGEKDAESQDGSNVLSINPTTKSINLNGTFTITYTAKSADGAAVTVTFTSSDPTVATVTDTGDVVGVGVGSATIAVVASNGLSKNCTVTVKDPSQGGGDYDIAVDKNLGYSGELTIGSPLLQRQFMMDLLEDFNALTGSTVKFTVTTFEEDNGTAGYGTAESMPAVFPYASDQTLTLYQFNALSTVGRTDASWIKDNMGDSAYNAAKLSSLVGYPFASDNGIVMFYDSSICAASDIDTLNRLFAYADANDYEVNFPIGTGFYAAGALMTYAQGNSLYTLTPTATSYTVSANFNSDAGLQSAKIVRRIANEGSVRNATSVPSKDTGVLATIVDASKVQDFKASLGLNYAVSPLPYVDDARITRLGSFLGYKFYGVNNTLSATDKTVAAAVAKFLCSEYVQVKRYDQYNVRPTLTTLASYAAGEAHIAALTAQEEAHSTIPLTAISSELWSAAATAVTSIKVLGEGAADSEYRTILDTLDKACQANN